MVSKKPKTKLEQKDKKTLLTQLEEGINNILEEPITVVRPVPQFAVLNSFARHGVYFTNLEDGEPINGLLNLPSIGVSLTPPEADAGSGLGFLNVNKKCTKDTYEVDGVLYFEYNGKECLTGRLSDKGDYLWFIKIWNDMDMHLWLDIIEKVVADNTIVKDDVSLPLANFIVSSAFVPNNSTEPTRLVLSKHMFNNRGTVAAVSGDEVYPLEDELYDDTDRHTPIF